MEFAHFNGPDGRLHIRRCLGWHLAASVGTSMENHGCTIQSKIFSVSSSSGMQGLAPACWASGRTSPKSPHLPKIRAERFRDQGSDAGMPRMAAKGVPMAATTCFNIPSRSNCKVGCKLLAASSRRAYTGMLDVAGCCPKNRTSTLEFCWISLQLQQDASFQVFLSFQIIRMPWTLRPELLPTSCCCLADRLSNAQKTLCVSNHSNLQRKCATTCQLGR